MHAALVDIGANLAHNSFKHDLPDVLRRAEDSGVGTIVVTGTSIVDSQQAAVLAAERAGRCYSTAGVHPHEADSFSVEDIDALRQLATLECVKAIGETGLDYNRNYAERSNQRFAFESQLQLAAELELPVFIHERDAASDMLDILGRYRSKIERMVVHCFTGDEGALRDYLDMDLYIGLTGWICDERRGQHLKDFAALIPKGRLMIETDAPYLLPRDYPDKSYLQSARRNEPCTLQHIASTIAQCRNETIEDFAAHTRQTSLDFFGITGE